MTSSCTARYRKPVVQFTLEPTGNANLVRSYSPDGIWIGERHVTRSCIVTASQLITEWAPGSFAELGAGHLDTIFDLAPELVVVGTGPSQQFAGAAIVAAFAARRIGLEVMHLGAACRTFNVLVQEGRPVAAAFFIR